MFLLKFGSELQNLLKKIQSVLKIQAKCRLNFHEEEYFYKVKCIPPHLLVLDNFVGLSPNYSDTPSTYLALKSISPCKSIHVPKQNKKAAIGTSEKISWSDF